MTATGEGAAARVSSVGTTTPSPPQCQARREQRAKGKTTGWELLHNPEEPGQGRRGGGGELLLSQGNTALGGGGTHSATAHPDPRHTGTCDGEGQTRSRKRRAEWGATEVKGGYSKGTFSSNVGGRAGLPHGARGLGLGASVPGSPELPSQAHASR